VALIGWAALGLLLSITEDPPPFQQAAWWVDSPVAALGVVVVAGGAWAATKWVPWIGALLLPLALTQVLERESPPDVPAATGPNVLLVTLDTTRADHTSAYGYERDTTPALAELAGQGTRFDAAYAPMAVTGPSHTTLLTGTGTWSHGTLLNGIPMPQDRRSLAEELQEQGWSTGAFVSAYVLEGRYGFRRGFETYDDDFERVEGLQHVRIGRLKATLVRRFRPDQVLERRGDRTVDEALAWRETQDGPWFLWVHLFDAHGPYEPPEPYASTWYQGDPRDPAHTSMDQVDNVASYLTPHLRGITDVDWVIAQYDGEIAYADAQLARLLDGVDLTQTVVVVSGDHGESLGEGGVWFNHGDDLFDAATRVPLVVAGPGIPAGQVVSTPVELGDVAPTVYGALGLAAPDSVEGQSLLASARTEARMLAYDRPANLQARELDPTQRPTFRVVGLRSDRSLFLHREAPGWDDALYVADCADCPLVVTTEPAPLVLVDRAGRLLTGDAARSAVEMSEEERLRLEALGYLQD
jgi:arylsulfatase